MEGEEKNEQEAVGNERQSKEEIKDSGAGKRKQRVGSKVVLAEVGIGEAGWKG